MGGRSNEAPGLQQLLAALDKPYRFVAACNSLKFCRVAEGVAEVYPRLGPSSQWDTSAAQAMVILAGGCVVSLDGKALTCGTDHKVLNPEFMVWGDKSSSLLFTEHGDHCSKVDDSS